MLAKKIAYNTAVQILGKTVGFFISGTLLVLIADRLGTAGMGHYVTVLAFVGFFVTLADLGANLILVRDVSQNEARREKITAEFFGFRLTFSLAVMILAPIIASFIPQYSPIIVKGMIIITVAQFLLLVNQMFISMLQTQLLLDRAVMAELTNRAVALGFIVLAIRLNVSGTPFFYAVLNAALVGAVVNTAMSYLFARRLWPIRPNFNRRAWRATLMTVTPIGVFSFLGMVHFKADTILLSLLKPPTDVGIYGYAYKIGEIIFTFPVMFVGAVFPKLSQLLKTNRSRFDQLAQTTFDFLVIGTIPFLTFVFIGAKYFTLLVARSSFADAIRAGQTLQILAVALLAWFIGTLFIHVLIMADDYRGLIYNLAIVVTVNLLLNFIVIPRYSYFGAAVTTGVTEILMLILTWGYTRRYMGFSPKVTFGKVVTAATVVMILTLRAIEGVGPFAYERFAVAGRFEQMGLILVLAALAGAAYLAVLIPFTGKRLLAYAREVQN